MKNLKIIYMAFVLALFSLVSCENNDPIIDVENITNKSVSAKIAMLELKSHFDTNGQLSAENNPTNNILFDYCFDFVYPITLSYNTGANVTIADFSALVDVIVNMTDSLYIDGIAFPFNIEIYDANSGGVIIRTITSEQEFAALVDSCEFDGDDSNCSTDYNPVCVEVSSPNGGDSFTVEFPNFCHAMNEGFTQADIVDCDTSTNPNNDNCFEYHFPISLVGANGGDTIVIQDEDELSTILYASSGYYSFVYPFDITTEDNQTRTITNEQEFSALLASCDGNVSTVYCVENLTVAIGDCIDDTSYAITVNFTATDDFTGDFSLYTGEDDVLFAVGSMNDLPLTLTMTLSGLDEDRIKVVLSDNATTPCSEEMDWYAPNCDTGNDPCWEFVYPVSFMEAGSTITVNDRASFDNEFNPQTSTLIYPFDVEIDNQTSTINTPNDFYTIGEFDGMCD